jgi:hypothetical protein
MNKHFEDAQYYLKRAGETAKKGVAEEVQPLQDRITKLAGKEPEPKPGRVEALRDEIEELRGRAEGDAKSALDDAKEKIDVYRKKRAE